MVGFKECFKCKSIKPLDEFYKHPRMLDGHLNKCKACAKSDVCAHREKNVTRIREYDKSRSKHPDRIKAAAEINRMWREQDRRRSAAHNAVARALKSGQLKRLPCERCGDKKSVAHHEDYDKKLDVIWLCQPCHKARHKEISEHLKENG